MRCSEARRRLIESGGNISADDKDVKKHLQSCHECAAFAAAEMVLSRDLALTAADDNIDEIPLSEFKTYVEARADSNRLDKTKEIPIMSAVVKQVKRRPSLGFAAGLAVAVLLLITLIPFSFENTVGYEVAIAGVNKELAMDTEKINELMKALGLEHVTIDVGDCEKTCVLKISDVDTPGDVNILVSAFDELGNCVLQDISEIHDSEKMTLLQHAHKNIFITTGEGPDGSEAHKIVIDALCHLDSATGGAFNIWITDDNDTLIMSGPGGGSDSPCVITLDGVDTIGDHMIFYSDTDPDSGTAVWMFKNPDKNALKYILDKNTGENGLMMIDEKGEAHSIDLSSPDFAEQLEAQGIKVHVSERDGELYYNFNNGKDDNSAESNAQPPEGLEYIDPAKADAEVQLPDNFELKQNHPNPFNPDTRIDFTLPETQNVKLEVYNVNGQKIRTLIDAVLTAGEHSIEWNATDDSGERIASGVYLYRLTAGIYTTSKKMTLLK